MIRPTGIINFAVGEWAMVASFGGFIFLTKYEWPYPLGMAAVVAVMILVGWATERIAVRPLVEKGAPLLAPDPRAARRAGGHPRNHLGQLPARSAAGAVPLRHRPHRDRADRRLLPELLHHRRNARGLRRHLVLLRENALGQELRGGGAQPQGRGADGHQSLARHRAVLRRRRRRRRAGRPAGIAEYLGALPDGRAARHPGLHRAGRSAASAASKARSSAACCWRSPSSSSRAMRRFLPATRRVFRSCS